MNIRRWYHITTSMKSIHIRDVDEGTLAALKRLARSHRRSLQAELQVILERAARTAPPEDRSTEPTWLIVNTGRRDARWSRGEIYDDRGR